MTVLAAMSSADAAAAASMQLMVGDVVCEAVGLAEGNELGVDEGTVVGVDDGAALGATEGEVDGADVGGGGADGGQEAG